MIKTNRRHIDTPFPFRIWLYFRRRYMGLHHIRKSHPNRTIPLELWLHIGFHGNAHANLLSVSDLVRSLITEHRRFFVDQISSSCINHGWDIFTSGFLKQTAVILEFYFRFLFGLIVVSGDLFCLGLPIWFGKVWLGNFSTSPISRGHWYL